MTVAEKISKARVKLLLDFPWYGALAMNLKIEACESIKTFDVDGVTMRYNPAFADSLPDAQLVTVIAHEVGHCALLHVYRRGSRDPQQWNEAADYIINNDLVEQGMELPEGCLLDPQFKGLCAEVVYAKIAKQQKPQTGDQQAQQPSSGQPQQGQQQSQQGASGSGKQQGGQQGSSGKPQKGSGQGSTSCPTGTFSDAPEPAGEHEAGSRNPSGQMTEQDWEIAAEQAARVARAAGKLSGSLERMIQGSRESKTDWRTELREFLEQTTPSDYSWQHPNRRFINQGIYLPGTVKEGFGRLAIAVDTSGSIHEKELNAFSVEITSICSELHPEQVTVVYCDAAINKVQDINPEEVKLQACGGGGTMFQPVFDEIAKWDEQPKAVLYFTDLECIDTPVEPEYPVLWVTGLDVTREPQFGRAIRVEV